MSSPPLYDRNGNEYLDADAESVLEAFAFFKRRIASGFPINADPDWDALDKLAAQLTVSWATLRGGQR